MKKFIYFRCYAFRLNRPRVRFSPRRSNSPPLRTIRTREIPYYGIVEWEARLIESPSPSIVPNPRSDSFIFEPPRFLQTEPIPVSEPVSSR